MYDSHDKIICHFLHCALCVCGKQIKDVLVVTVHHKEDWQMMIVGRMIHMRMTRKLSRCVRVLDVLGNLDYFWEGSLEWIRGRGSYSKYSRVVVFQSFWFCFLSVLFVFITSLLTFRNASVCWCFVGVLM